MDREKKSETSGPPQRGRVRLDNTTGAPDFPGGYCSRACGAGAPTCPSGSSCIGGSVCVVDCTMGSDCRSGTDYACSMPTGATSTVCWPS